MYRFWSSGSRGSDKTADATHLGQQQQQHLDCAKPPIAPGATDITLPSPKRARPASVDTQCAHAPSKRIKTEHRGELLSPVSVADGECDDATMSRRSSSAVDLDRARDVIQHQFGLEILLKHEELRLINQEMAKCQVALEQLRRCHLMPYPTHCPTPSQMLEISSGKGPVLQAQPGQAVPKWAPPFGVVEGPYARHYAKWLIPDPAFDGVQPQARGPSEASRSRNAQVESGRTTRNSMPDVGAAGKPRSGRAAGQKLQALSSGHPQPKDKQAPCVLKRSDGVTVKLVCHDCHRFDFSSTQGFINHCRIAHKREYKSHDEAAVHCGIPIDVDEAGGIVGADSKPAPAATVAAAPAAVAPVPTGLVHPLVRDQEMSEEHAYNAVASRIRASMALFHAGRLPGVGKIPTAPATPATLVESSETPFLTQLMRKKNRGINLDEHVEDAKQKVDWDMAYQADADDDMDRTPSEEPLDLSAAARASGGVMRVPARAPAPRRESSTAVPPPSSKKSSSSRFAADGTTTPALNFSDLPSMFTDIMDVDLTPNTMTSNKPPSLVSDSSGDEEEVESSSEASEAESEASDVAEVGDDEDHEAVMQRRSSGSGRKEEANEVTFVKPTPPLTSGGKGGKRKKAAQPKRRVA